jgi:arylsulfatase A-like enzyme
MTKRKNVVVFFTDQQRWDSTGVHGNPLGLTPNFDRVAKTGTHCYNTYTCQPVCGPARASLQTGLYATNAGVPTNGGIIREGCKTLGEYFSEAGYHTGYIGKWHLGQGAEQVDPCHRKGYQYWLGSNALEHTSDAYFTVMYDNDGNPVELPGYRVDALADAGIRYINEHKHEPFFLMMSFIEPHFQNHRDDYPAPVGYEEQYRGRWTPPDLQDLEGGTAGRHLGGYWGMVKRLDEAYGRVLDALMSLGLDDDTIIVFTSDHACHFKTRNHEYKRSCHESSSRIPMAFSGGEFKGGGEIRDLVSLIDVPPTLLDAAGVDIPEVMEGHSIMPLVRRQQADRPKSIFIQISEDIAGRAIRLGRWKYSVRHIDEADRKNPSPTRYKEDFLYDLHADPYELDNRIGFTSLAEITSELRTELKNWVKKVEGIDINIEEATPRNPGQRYTLNQRPFEMWDN